MQELLPPPQSFGSLTGSERDGMHPGIVDAPLNITKRYHTVVAFSIHPVQQKDTIATGQYASAFMLSVSLVPAE
jgi:hypothetical protein